MSGYTVRAVPNTNALRTALRSLKGGLPVRLRGRGVPEGKTWRDVAFGTAMREAPEFMAYYGSAPYVRFEFVGMSDEGKLRVRLLS